MKNLSNRNVELSRVPAGPKSSSAPVGPAPEGRTMRCMRCGRLGARTARLAEHTYVLSHESSTTRRGGGDGVLLPCPRGAYPPGQRPHRRPSGPPRRAERCAAAAQEPPTAADETTPYTLCRHSRHGKTQERKRPLWRGRGRGWDMMMVPDRTLRRTTNYPARGSRQQSLLPPNREFALQQRLACKLRLLKFSLGVVWGPVLKPILVWDDRG